MPRDSFEQIPGIGVLVILVMDGSREPSVVGGWLGGAPASIEGLIFPYTRVFCASSVVDLTSPIICKI